MRWISGATLLLVAGVVSLGAGIAASGSESSSGTHLTQKPTTPAITVAHKKSKQHRPRTPQEFISAMTGKGYPAGVKSSSSKSWGDFQQEGPAASALNVLEVSEPPLADQIDYYVFSSSQTAASFYASPGVGIPGFAFEGMSLVTVPHLPKGSEAFGVTECGGASTELTATTCSGTGYEPPPYVVGAALYSRNGFVVTVAGYISAGLQKYVTMPGFQAGEVAAAKKAISTLKDAITFASTVER